jgi:DNA-binding CsgD family transcriptional regulator
MKVAVPDSLMEEIQQLQDTFSAVMDQAIVLTDQEGNIFTRPTIAGRFYKEMLDSLQGITRPFEQPLRRLGSLSQPVVLEEWVPGLKYVISPLVSGYGQVYYLWSGLYMELGAKEQVLRVFEAQMKHHTDFEQLLAGLAAIPEFSRERIAEVREKLTALGSIICKLLTGLEGNSVERGIGQQDTMMASVRTISGQGEVLLRQAQLGKEGILRLKEAAGLLPQAESMKELGTQILDVVMGLPFYPSSVLVHFQHKEHPADTYFSRGWAPQSEDYYIQELEVRYSPHSFLSSAIIREAAGGQTLLECPMMAGNEFKGILSVGFKQRDEAEQWMILLETVAGLAGAAIRLIEQDSRYLKQSEVLLANFRQYLQNNNAVLQDLSLDVSEMAYDFARYLNLSETEAEQVKRAGLLAPFRSDLLEDYGFFKNELLLLKQVDELPSSHSALPKPVLPLSVQVLMLVLQHIGRQAEPEQLMASPQKWIDPSRFSLDSAATAAVIADESLSLFQSFLQSHADCPPKKRITSGTRLLDSAALTLSKEEWGISPREEEVLELIVHGKTNKEIAGALFISEHTVKNHLSRIFNKMNVTDRSQIIALVYKQILNSERIEI